MAACRHIALALVAVVSVSGSDGSEGGGGSRLKMGVLKRPDALRCTTKSRVGDVLAVHATVSQMIVHVHICACMPTTPPIVSCHAYAREQGSLPSHARALVHTHVRLHLTLNPRLQGKLHETGEVFDTHSPQDEPFEFTLGSGEVIEGLNSALLGYAQHLTPRNAARADLCTRELIFSARTCACTCFCVQLFPQLLASCLHEVNRVVWCAVHIA
jgi:hypothetical protein